MTDYDHFCNKMCPTLLMISCNLCFINVSYHCEFGASVRYAMSVGLIICRVSGLRDLLEDEELHIRRLMGREH